MANQNKFTKSVLERLAEETEKQGTVEPEGETETKKTSSPKRGDHTAVKKQHTGKAKEIPDISQFIIKKEERIAKNKTFYLDSDVIETVKSVAKAQQLTDSRLVNDILRKVLGLSNE